MPDSFLDSSSRLPIANPCPLHHDDEREELVLSLRRLLADDRVHRGDRRRAHHLHDGVAPHSLQKCKRNDFLHVFVLLACFPNNCLFVLR